MGDKCTRTPQKTTPFRTLFRRKESFHLAFLPIIAIGNSNPPARLLSLKCPSRKQFTLRHVTNWESIYALWRYLQIPASREFEWSLDFGEFLSITTSPKYSHKQQVWLFKNPATTKRKKSSIYKNSGLPMVKNHAVRSSIGNTSLDRLWKVQKFVCQLCLPRVPGPSV